MPSSASDTVPCEKERAELETVLQAPMFVRSPALARLLTYVCEKVFANETEQIKEYSIAIDVFGRDANFDQDSDSIVRVEANRLRKKLVDYYNAEGATRPLRITIPVGQYVPLFEENKRGLTNNPATKTTSRQTQAFASTHFRWPWRILAGISLIIVVALVVLFERGRHLSRSASSTDTPRAVDVSEPSVGLPVGEEIRILAGSTRSYVDRSGKQWNADAFFSGGTSVRSAIQQIWRTQDPSIYRTSRQGDFTYNIPLKPGKYELHLHFAETFYGPEDSGGGGEGSRIMTVTANDKPLLTDFDVLADSGGGRTADVKVFVGIHPADDGVLHLGFSSVKGGRGMVSAIEILPGLDANIRPVRIVARDVPYYSEDSQWWSSDVYFKGGQLRNSETEPFGGDDPELYSSERWGNFSYAIPVAPGKYAITLHFIERNFHPADHEQRTSDPGTSAQRRVFSVFVNHHMVIRDLNILEEAGENRPLVRRITGLEPNPQGKLLVEFMPSQYYATVTAIEVMSQ